MGYEKTCNSITVLGGFVNKEFLLVIYARKYRILSFNMLQ